MSYQFYKILHVVSIVIFFSAFAVSVFRADRSKMASILSGIFILIVLVSGFGLLAKIGVLKAGGWPLWIKIKLVIWGILAVFGHLIVKKWPMIKVPFYILCVGLLIIAATAANYKFL